MVKLSIICAIQIIRSAITTSHDFGMRSNKNVLFFFEILTANIIAGCQLLTKQCQNNVISVNIVINSILSVFKLRHTNASFVQFAYFRSNTFVLQSITFFYWTINDRLVCLIITKCQKFSFIFCKQNLYFLHSSKQLRSRTRRSIGENVNHAIFKPRHLAFKCNQAALHWSNVQFWQKQMSRKKLDEQKA